MCTCVGRPSLMSKVMNCGCKVWRNADRLLGTRRCAPSLAPWLVEHVEMSVEGDIDSHWKVWLHDTRGMRLERSLVF